MTKILLVEDDKNLREIYSVRLQAEGYEIVSAGDGEEALAVAIKEKPDLIISDVMMPKISGFDMLDILRSTPETKNVKVIMMTALSSDDQRARGEALGADRYLVKSQVGIEDVVATVKDVLAGNSAPASTAPITPATPPIAPTTPTPPTEAPIAPPVAPVVSPVNPTAVPPQTPPVAPIADVAPATPPPVVPTPMAPAPSIPPVVNAVTAPSPAAVPPVAPISAPAPAAPGAPDSAPLPDLSFSTPTPPDLTATLSPTVTPVSVPEPPAPAPSPVTTAPAQATTPNNDLSAQMSDLLGSTPTATEPPAPLTDDTNPSQNPPTV